MPTEKKPRGPYWILETQFRAMGVLENRRQICEHCGHIIFPEDQTFWCPCQRCVEVHFSLTKAGVFPIHPGLRAHSLRTGVKTRQTSVKWVGGITDVPHFAWLPCESLRTTRTRTPNW